MRSPLRFSAAIALVATLAPSAVRADWPTNSSVNLPVCTAANLQNVPSIATDMMGGAYIAWHDGRIASNSDIYVHHVLSSGVVDPAWTSDGLLVCGTLGTQTIAQVTSDGSGGVLVAWNDLRSGNSDIYAHHVLVNGTVDPGWPENGLPVCTATGTQSGVRMVPDAAGGALLVWRDLRNDTDLFVARVLAEGVVDPVWPVNGIALASGAGTQKFGAVVPMVSDGQGGLFATWMDTRDGPEPDIYAQHLLVDGTVAAGWPLNGLAVCKAANIQQFPSVARDRAGGVFIGWEDLRSGSTFDVYTQHVLAGGSVDPAWPMDGRATCEAAGHQTRASVLGDLAGGAYVAWVDYRAGSIPALSAQHLLANGTLDPAWPAEDLALNPIYGSHGDLLLLPDGTGGALAVWDDGRSGLDVYGQHMLVSGVVDPAWPVGGRAIGSASQSQDASGAAIQDGSGGLIVAWSDSRAGGGANDIYAQRVRADGTLGGSVVGVPREMAGRLTISASPNPWRGGVLTVRCTLGPGRGASLELFDLAGRALASRVLAPGEGAADFENVSVAPGIYFIVLRETGGARSVRTTRVVALR